MDVVYHSRCIHAPRWEGHMIKIQRKNILKSKYPPILQKKKKKEFAILVLLIMYSLIY